MKKLNFILVSIVVIITLLLISAPAFTQNWTFTNGPHRPHEVRDLSSAKVGSVQTIYAADVETLKFTTNGGATWQNTGTLMLNPLVVGAKPDDANILHVGKLGELRRSINGGGTWELNKIPDANLVPLRLGVSTSDQDYWLLGTDTVERSGTWTTSLYRTLDGGASWSPLNYFKDTSRTNINDVIFHSDSNETYVGGSRRPSSEPPEMTNETTTSIKQKGVWFSSNRGESWTFRGRLSSGSDSGTNRNVTALALSMKPSSELLFAATRLNEGGTIKAKLYQSGNNGASWIERANLHTQIAASIVQAMKVSPVKPETLIAVTDKGFAVSLNRGTDWQLRNTGLGGLHAPYQVIFDRNDPTGNTLYIATDPTVYVSYNLGANWIADKGIFDFMKTVSFAINGNTAHGVMNSYSGIARWNFFHGWIKIPKVVGQKQFSGEAVVINRTNAAFANAVGDSAGRAVIYVRTASGDGWRKVFTSAGGSNSTPLSTVVVDPKTNSQRVYAGGKFRVSTNFYNFIRSTNLGVDWGSQVRIGLTNGVPVRAIAIDPSSGSTYSMTLYAGLGKDGGAGLGVRKSTNGGDSWDAAAQLNGHEIISTTLASSSVLYLGSPNNI